jgi:hypothetical protein
MINPPFYPSQVVKCINAKPIEGCVNLYLDKLTEGEKYHVKKCRWCHEQNVYAVELKEVPILLTDQWTREVVTIGYSEKRFQSSLPDSILSSLTYVRSDLVFRHIKELIDEQEKV